MAGSVPNYLPGFEPESIRTLLGKFFLEIDAAFPDKTIVWSKWNHERWDKAAGYLCKNLGYARGSEFLEAYGYTVVAERKESVPRIIDSSNIHTPSISADEYLSIEESKDKHPKNIKESVERPISKGKVEKANPKQNKKPGKKVGIITACAIFVLLLIIVGVGNSISNQKNSINDRIRQSASSPTSKLENESNSVLESAETKIPIPTVKPTSAPVKESDNSKSPTNGEKKAVKKAKDYLSFTAFSQSGLVTQLEFEGYSHDEAVYGAANCGADWNEQAIKKAKNYLDLMSFSQDGLIIQLEYDGFTHEQAVYGVNNCGSNENEQVVAKAKSYLELLSFSRNGLITQLEYDGFAHDIAVYGADNCSADWNAQAVKKAKDYMNIMSFSKENLITQLEYDGFTHEQAVYGVDQAY